MNAVLKQILLLWRDKFTGWWLLTVCDKPKTAIAFVAEVREEMERQS